MKVLHPCLWKYDFFPTFSWATANCTHNLQLLFFSLNKWKDRRTNKEIKETSSNMFSNNSLLKEQLCGELANFWDKHIFDRVSLPMYPGMLTEKQDSSGQPRVKGGTISHLQKGSGGTLKKIQSSVQLDLLEESHFFHEGKKCKQPTIKCTRINAFILQPSMQTPHSSTSPLF